jgi:octaprenyl-diphosphate synthase
VAFQAIDDVLDLTGDAETTGKALFADLREGKVTYPAMVAMQRDPKVGELLKRAASDEEAGAELFKEIRARMESTGAIAEGKALAEARASEAIQALDALPEGCSREALATVALAVVARRA